MELINKYRHSSYRKFECDYVWLNTNTEKQVIRSYLEKKQKGQSHTHRFHLSDIENILSEDQFNDLPEGFTLKLVIQKANFNVKQSTVNNGYTTRLLFLIKDTGEEGDWYFYGFAKGLYNELKLLNVNEKQPFGWSLYISLIEKESNLSGGFTNSAKLKKLIARLKANKVN